MPRIYLSPSVQEENSFVTGGNEEYYMNLIADAMIPYLRTSGIEFTRNNPGVTLLQLIEQANSEHFDLHLALHSNSSTESLAGILQGPDVYYYAFSAPGKEAAALIGDGLKTIYPEPSLVTVIPTTTIAEIRRTRAPSVLVEIAYHDNYDDAQWMENNINLIAKKLVHSISEYFHIPDDDVQNK